METAIKKTNIYDEITGLEEEIEQMDQKITENVTNSARLNELVKSKEELEAKLDEKMERWVYLNDLNEKIMKQQEG